MTQETEETRPLNLFSGIREWRKAEETGADTHHQKRPKGDLKVLDSILEHIGDTPLVK
ncbi:hypothetical protein SARC_14701, partial [Sphaeroforma arctica JP610]